jgi:hypothetical protein
MSYEDQSHRFVITGEDPDGHPRTIILWRETDLVNGKVIRRVHITLDATTVTETILTQRDAVAVAEAILEAAPVNCPAQWAVPAGPPSTLAAGRGLPPQGRAQGSVRAPAAADNDAIRGGHRTQMHGLPPHVVVRRHPQHARGQRGRGTVSNSQGGGVTTSKSWYRQSTRNQATSVALGAP